jgi:hypothetical protein
MNLDRAKRVQIEIMTRLLDYELLPPGRDGYPRFRPGPWAKRPRRGTKTPIGKVDPRKVIAAGIIPPKLARDRDGYRILITCQRKSDLSSALVKSAVKLAGGEAKVIYTGLVTAAVTAAKKVAAQGNVVRIGDSIGRTNAAGSVGCFVSLPGDPAVFVLSNNHVLARNNKGKKGADIRSPAPGDGTAKIIADLHDWHNIDFGGTNTADCALAKIRAGVAIDRHNVQFTATSPPEQISGQVAPTSSLSTGDKVRTLGRISRGTSGEIESVSQPVTLSAGEPDEAFYSGQIVIKSRRGAFAVVGDSGAVVFNDAMDAVGLIFAVNQVPPLFAFCNPMPEVLTVLGATL